MRRFVVTSVALISFSSMGTGCAVGDVPIERIERVSRVEQPLLEDSLADDQFGQPDLLTGTEPTVVTSITAHHPAGIAAVNSFSVSTATLLWIADFDAHRAIGMNVFRSGTSPGAPFASGASNWFGQLTLNEGLPNAGGSPSSRSLFGPSAIAISSTYLAIADPGNHRALVGYALGTASSASAVFGQHGSFTNAVRNDGGIGRGSLADPAGVAVDSLGRLYIADTGNHRVLTYLNLFTPDAAVVYGQVDFDQGAPNRGGDVSANTLNSPLGLAAWKSPVPADPGGFYVADSGNHRVLHFATGSTTADAVYGQGGSFTTALPSKGGISASSLRTPSGVAVDAAGGLWIADTGHHRVLHFKRGSTVADRVLGQASFTTGVPPTSTSASSLSSPTSVAVAPCGDVFVSDTGASRVLRYKVSAKTPGGCDDLDPCTDDYYDPTYGCRHTLTSQPTECAPYLCDFSTHTCRTSCSLETGIGCRSPAICRNGTCAQPCSAGPGGLACRAGTYCVDGFCCDSRCDKRCGACNLGGKEGRCSIVTGPPVGPARACPGVDPDCRGDCAGTDFDACIPAPTTRPCGLEYCEEGVAHLRGHCDATGRCLAVQQECAPYGCTTNACRTTCADDSHCAKDAVCVEGRCLGEDNRIAGGTGCDLSRAPRVPASAFLAAFVLALGAIVRRRVRRSR